MIHLRSNKNFLLVFTGLIFSTAVTLALSNLRAEAQGVINVSSCQVITSSGNYRLANNISGSGWCISIRASNVDFDGNGKTITSSSGDALEVAHFSGAAPTNVTVHDFTSAGGIRTYGDTVSTVTLENLTVGGIVVYGSNNVTIRNNTVGNGGINVNDADNNWSPTNPVISNNTITGQVGHTTKILLEVAGGKFHPCPRINAVVTGNTVNNYRNDPPPEATASIRIRCATHSTVTGNFFRSHGTTIGLYIRDEADDSLYENNTFWTNTQESIRIASGNVDKTFPARNIFRNNIFRSDTGKGTYFQGVGSDNLFQYNVFWSAVNNDFIHGGHNNTFDHNTFYVVNSGEDVIWWDLDSDPADVFTNNIFSYSGTNIFTYDNFIGSRYTGNYNLFHNRSGSLSFGSFGSSLSAWRTNTGDDANSINANPQFADTTGVFALNTGSPALNAASDGTNIGAWQNSACTESWSCGAWSSCANNTQTRTCTDANSCGTTVSRPPLTQTCDSTAPTITITAPTNGATVSGLFNITATASDNVGVAGVQFKLNGTNLGPEDTAAPYVYSWDTTSAANGPHTITAVARDAAGLTTTSSGITFTVNNAVACTESWGCGAWSSCTNNTQTRTCTDANSCGTTVSRPPLTQTCTPSELPDTIAPSAVVNLRVSGA